MIRIPSEFVTPEPTSAPETRSRITLLLQNKQQTLSEAYYNFNKIQRTELPISQKIMLNHYLIIT